MNRQTIEDTDRSRRTAPHLAEIARGIAVFSAEPIRARKQQDDTLGSNNKVINQDVYVQQNCPLTAEKLKNYQREKS